MPPIRESAYPEGGLYVNIKEVTFLYVKGYQEIASGPKYLFVDKMWLTADAGVPFDLLRAYRRVIIQVNRLITLRTRKRVNKEVDLVKVRGCFTKKKIKRA